MGLLNVLLLSIFAITAVLLIILILLQDEQSDGIGGIFGGGASNQVGNRKGNILTKTTTVLGFIFIIVALTTAWINHNQSTASGIEKAALAKQKQETAVEWWKTTGTETSLSASESPSASAAATDSVPAASSPAAPVASASASPAASAKPSPAPTKK